MVAEHSPVHTAKSSDQSPFSYVGKGVLHSTKPTCQLVSQLRLDVSQIVI